MPNKDAPISPRVDPQLVDNLLIHQSISGGELDLSNIDEARANTRRVRDLIRASLPPMEGVATEDHIVKGKDSANEIMVRVYRPEGCEDTLPALLWIHGGGFVLGSVDDDDLYAASLCKAGQCCLISVEYRLAPEHPYPAPLEDCYQALAWAADNTALLNIDPARIAIGGDSAGGGLAAGLALLARDRKGPAVCFQLLMEPMLDPETTSRDRLSLEDAYVWSRNSNRRAWSAYLDGHTLGDCSRSDADIYAAPAKAENLEGLAPAFIAVGDVDLFAHEDASYAQKLMAANVATEFHLYPGGYHAFYSFAPKAEISKQCIDARDKALYKHLHPSC